MRSTKPRDDRARTPPKGCSSWRYCYWRQSSVAPTNSTIAKITFSGLSILPTALRTNSVPILSARCPKVVRSSFCSGIRPIS